MMTRKIKGFVVSHTHWDREWYLPFQGFRMKLVAMIDELLDVLDKDPDFRCFMLDGQTIVLEDYLEIRPENEERLKKYVREGRILVGPWYLQPDENLTSPEALVRNLQLGFKIAEEFGKVMKVGYVPDSFGHIPQLPQVFNEFGLSSFIFTRGMRDDLARKILEETKSGTFQWIAPDEESQVFAIWLKVSYGNAHDFGRLSKEINLEERLDLLTRLFVDEKYSFILLMNGSDHLGPAPEIPSLIKNWNRDHKDIELVHTDLPSYIKALKQRSVSLVAFQGELRGNRYWCVLPSVASSRMYLKQANREASEILERWAEPFSTLSWLLGAFYPQSYLARAWKLLLENQTHDGICGCSADKVHQEMETRFTRTIQISDGLTKKGLSAISEKINTENQKGIPLIVFNPLSWPRKEAVSTTVKLSPDFDSRGQYLVLEDLSGNLVSLQAKPQKGSKLEVSFIADLPAFGYKTYWLKTRNQFTWWLFNSDIRAGNEQLENAYFQIEVNPNGSLTVTDRQTNKIYRDLNIFEDGGDAGDSYNYSQPLHDELITSESCKAKISLEEIGPAKATLKIRMNLYLPESLDHKEQRRSQKKVKCPIVSYVTLYSRIPRIDIKTEVTNNVKDHRLRVLFLTDIQSDFSHAETPFYVISRPVKNSEKRKGPQEELYEAEIFEEYLTHIDSSLAGKCPAEKETGWVENDYPTHAHRSFVDVNDGEYGFALFNKGLPECEVKDDEERTIALTLIRAVGWIFRGDLEGNLRTRRGYDHKTERMQELFPPVPDAQCLGKNVFEYSLYPHQGSWLEAGVHLQAHEYNAGLEVVQTQRHNGELPQESSFLSLEPASLVLSAFKKRDSDNSIILRFFNISDKEVEGTLKFFRKIKKAEICDLREEPQRKLRVSRNRHEIRLKVGKCKIVTIRLVL